VALMHITVLITVHLLSHSEMSNNYSSHSLNHCPSVISVAYFCSSVYDDFFPDDFSCPTTAQYNTPIKKTKILITTSSENTHICCCYI